MNENYMRTDKPVIWLFIAIVLYTSGHLFWYWQTPLGQMPALDGQENLILADQVTQGELPDEPFYRAMFYPALLGILPIHWMLLGWLCHIANAALAMRLARKLWNHRIGELLTGALVGLNPVLLHFAFDPLDITFSLTLFLLSLNFATPASEEESPPPLRFAWAGLCLALAFLARAHFFAILLPAVLLALGVAAFSPARRSRAAAFFAAAVIPLLAFGLLQQVRSGAFKLLPTQGGYSLWVSNSPTANGLYYKQTLNFHYTGEHQNPALLESAALYQQETGKPGSIEEQSAYWRRKTVQRILEEPGSWIQLMSFKTYAWLNNAEQYNNKTYAFHKALSPWLRLNPIGWGLLLTLASVPLCIATPQRKGLLLVGLGLFALYSAGALLYMASARFRLPLVPLLAIAAGGLPALLAQAKSFSPKKRLGSGALVLALAVLSFSRFSTVASEETFQQDAMLLADTASRLGRDLDAYRWANEALALNPERPDTKRLRLLAYYNLASLGQAAPTGAAWIDFQDDLSTIALSDPAFDFAKGVAYWNLGNTDTAVATWQHSIARYAWDASASLAALLYTGSPLPETLPTFPAGQQAASPLIVYALNRCAPADLKSQLHFPFEVSDASYAAIEQSLQHVLPKSP